MPFRDLCIKEYEEEKEAKEREERERKGHIVQRTKEWLMEWGVKENEIKPNFEKGTVGVDGLTFTCDGPDLKVLMRCSRCGKEEWVTVERRSSLGRMLSEGWVCFECKYPSHPPTINYEAEYLAIAREALYHLRAIANQLSLLTQKR